jgi:hypothetical protein
MLPRLAPYKMTAKDANTTQRGQQYEDLALAFLLEQGLQLVARNYRCRWGGIGFVNARAGYFNYRRSTL